ncbi:hypothetical protein [Nonomuraea sp. NPDC052265]|uniref:hypothetical protein n=1 Tax=Nonomuraea sp. NPDC052265 TaxID=3364374 RepID=UPI0037CBF923
MTAQLGRARAALAATSYSAASMILPSLIQAAETTAADAAGRVRDRAHALLADAYVLAAMLATKAHTDAVAWVAADRALRAARASGDVLAVAGAAREVAIAMRRQGRHASATGLLADTAARLDAGTGQTDSLVLARYVNLLCTAAYASAQAGKPHDADTFISEAELAARRLRAAPPALGIPTPATVAAYRISIHNALGDPSASLTVARTVDPGPVADLRTIRQVLHRHRPRLGRLRGPRPCRRRAAGGRAGSSGGGPPAIGHRVHLRHAVPARTRPAPAARAGGPHAERLTRERP